MNLTGTVISVALETTATKQAGGTYPAWQLVFKDSEGKVKDITKHVNGLKYTKGLKESLQALSPGDEFTAVLEKKGDFNEVTQIVKGANVPVASASSAPAAVGKVTGSNYETPTEREWNRVRIIRQSSISNAINLLKNEKKPPTTDEVLAVAVEFAKFVNQKDEDNV